LVSTKTRSISAIVSAILLLTSVEACSQRSQATVEPTHLSDQIGGGLSGGQVSSKVWESTVKAVLPGIVKINIDGCGFTGSGSGFRIGNWIVTNRHVVDEARQLEFEDYKHRMHSATKWLFSTTDDLALIRIEQETVLPALHLGTKDSTPGDLVATGGYPLGGPQVSERGHLVRKVKEYELSNSSATFVWETTAPILPGDSGGPMLDKRGQVVGIMFAVNNENNYTLAIPLSRIRATILGRGGLQHGRSCS
jgi:S1-C subfamily serine protease